MSELEEKLSGILSDPNMMQQIMNMARMLGSPQEPQKAEEHQKPSQKPAPSPGMDLSAVERLAGLVGQSGVDASQLGLLKALEPYLSRDRIIRLERAMHAARMAGAASSLLHSGGLMAPGGR